MDDIEFRKEIWGYYRRKGRDLPWRRTRNPYRILISEFMLQQTQVSRVLGTYPKFLRRFPNVRSLSRARKRTVLREWQGLGYNRRARALWMTAKKIVSDYGGRVPHTEERLLALPGVGRGTAGAVGAFAFNLPVVFIETNIRRVFLRFFFQGKESVPDAKLFSLIERTLDRRRPREWYYALMDYGAMLGAREKENPNTRSAHYKKQSSFKGSRRELRGKILALLLQHPHMESRKISEELGVPIGTAKEILTLLRKDGLVS